MDTAACPHVFPSGPYGKSVPALALCCSAAEAEEGRARFATLLGAMDDDGALEAIKQARVWLVEHGAPLECIPPFLRSLCPPDFPRVLDDVEPALCFRCDTGDWHDLDEVIEEFWWSVRYIRAYAYGGDIGNVLRYEAALQEQGDWIVDRLARYGVAEADTRAWLAAFRIKTNRKQTRVFDYGEDDPSP